MRASLAGQVYVEQYVRALTHEIKSPLSAIRGAAESLERPGLAAERHVRLVGSLSDSELRAKFENEDRRNDDLDSLVYS